MDSINATKRTDIYQVDPRNVVVVANFNVRRDFDIEELKEQIKAKGVLNPITVIPFKDENGVEKYKLVDGERRLRATLAAIEEGAEIARIKAIYLNRATKEEDLLIEQMMRNEGKNFTEYECAIMFLRFKENFGYTQAEIASKFKKSTAFVSRCLSLMELAPEIQEKLGNNEISVKAVRDIVANVGEDEGKQVEAVNTAVESAKQRGEKTATNRDVDSDVKVRKDAQKVKKVLQNVWATMEAAGSEVDYIKLPDLIAALDEKGNIEEAIKNVLGL
ncbi:ParB/RepB/Spo0J family partition protein [Bacteroides xylanisolvens]|uniref:ParB/RepB/Spo0J family partition protein n=1 Tax=Bacteroides xylanisolvens TaxID=371601 RepID=UPI001D092941|nr:ParB/RepB/Spo0J family partition protein [Bacteroides xylanisolvens]MCB6712314.1 ParB/RepB/Spo0J family partition protein [Bacteroides xylanisolvens]MCB6732370.1 ParB/RepB/Spo0J family partition protein [Bacteroides xylanisolvens]MCB7119669.1 ParB/RepB/Spo0J family partition protein [Bacteroides xylanisolvens]